MYLNEELSPEILKTLSETQKYELCSEIRKFLIDIIPKTGGHLASNLGTVELITALHSVFSYPSDKIIYDVGHQAYTHKLITGRYIDFYNLKLRTKNGISGFIRPSESIYDSFISGHGSISVSAALGFSRARDIQKNINGKIIAVVGDGAFTGGQIFSALNNTKRNDNIIIILNDNQYSISKNTGTVSDYFSYLRSRKKYIKVKKDIKNVLSESLPVVSHTISKAKKTFKHLVLPDNMFENLGFKYYGIIDGHNIEELTEILTAVKNLEEPCVIHIKTVKGKGYKPAEKNAPRFHSVPILGKDISKTDSFTEIFGEKISQLASLNKKICLVTAAMKYATGSSLFAKNYNERFFDVGMSEEHAVTFCAGLFAEGLLPVFTVYSTFLQRCFDQIIHDLSIEKYRCIFAIDRAGLVGEDGETHQGLFDAGMFSLIPETEVFSPETTDELELCLSEAVNNSSKISAVRYPRGIPFYFEKSFEYFPYKLYNYSDKNKNLVITYGRLTDNFRSILGINILKLIKILPVSEVFDSIPENFFKNYNNIFIAEEAISGISEKLCTELVSINFSGKIFIRKINTHPPVGTIKEQMQYVGLDNVSLEKWINSKKD